jgi:RimJ/RimL family protein N-acetyltransferase
MLSLPLAPDAELTTLEPWQADEFAEHIDRHREHLAPWIPLAHTVTDTESARELLQRYAERQANGAGRLLGIRLRGELVGAILFPQFDPAVGNCELGVWLAPHAQGHGLITRAAQLMIDWAFDVRGMHRIEWITMPANERSKAVAKRLGMSLDGVLRQSYLFGGRRHDAEIWSLLVTDPRPWKQ